jgi:hypothetical protein
VIQLDTIPNEKTSLAAFNSNSTNIKRYILFNLDNYLLSILMKKQKYKKITDYFIVPESTRRALGDITNKVIFNLTLEYT